MFAKVQDPTFATAINISKFDAITVRRTDRGYALSVYNEPLQSDAFHDIATFPSEQQTQMVFENLMVAIADGKPYWSLNR